MGALVLLTCLVTSSLAGEPGTGAPQHWPPPERRVTCGPLVFEVHVSRTAHLFHVVDQLADWDDACHDQFRAHMPLTAQDEELLAGFAEVRSRRRWGQGLEQTFYTPLDLEDAVRAGIAGDHITRAEADVILPVLEHFAGRVDELLASRRALLSEAFARLDRERFTRAAEKLARFVGVKELVLPTFPLASPTPGGGGMDGGRLRWELGSEDPRDVSYYVLLHEATHGFFMQRQSLLDELVERTPGMTRTLLGEGFAYAVAPGLYPDGELSGRHDPLRHDVARGRERDAAWKDPGNGREKTYALALRPLLAEALENSTLEAFLPRVRDIFLALREVLEASTDAHGPPRLAIAGPAADEVRARMLESRFRFYIMRFPHQARVYSENLAKLGAGDLFVITVARDEGSRIPAAHARVSPLTTPELRDRLRHGPVAEVHELSNGVRVVLLAAPTLAKLRELVNSTDLLEAAD